MCRHLLFPEIGRTFQCVHCEEHGAHICHLFIFCKCSFTIVCEWTSSSAEM